MATVKLDRVSNGLQTEYTAVPQFFARDIPVTESERDIIITFETRHKILRDWMERAYDAMSTERGVPPPFPKELVQHDEEQKANARQKARAAQRVRGASSGAASSDGGDV